MAGKRGRKRPQSPKIVEQNHDVDESIDTKSTVSASPSMLEPEIARNQLRERWELASVLNFLQVFKSVIQSKLDISADEIEAALIKPNDDLSQLHISLLKGIPPVNKNLTSPDAWVTILYKKLDPWWRWVADGEIPLNPSQGEELTTYKELDPINRLLILKALCEVRALQEDSISYLNGSLKQGTDICTFRKERIGGDATGISYWCEGDNVMGYRLYREVKVDFTPRKGKGRLMPQPIYEWETLATNLEEFQQLSDKFSTCDVGVEAAVGEIIENEVISDLVQTQKKREKALKKQQKQLMSLKGYLNSYAVGATRSCRSRKPVKYTFDEYDKTIEEAIKEGHINKKRKTVTEPKRVKANGSLVNGDVEHDTSDGDDSTDEEDDKLKSVGGDSDSKSDSGDEDYDNKTDEDNDTNKKGNNGHDKRAKNRFGKTNGDAAGLRRSQRVTGNGSRRSSDSDSNSDTVSDNGSSPESSVDKAADGEDPESEDESSSKGSAEKMSVDGSDGESASKGSADEAPADGSDNESDSKDSADEASEDGSEDENASKGSAENVSADGSDGESASKGSAADGSDDESVSKVSADKAAVNDSDGESDSKGSVEKVSGNYSEESEEENDGEKESSDEDEESEEESEDDE